MNVRRVYGRADAECPPADGARGAEDLARAGVRQLCGLSEARCLPEAEESGQPGCGLPSGAGQRLAREESPLVTLA